MTSVGEGTATTGLIDFGTNGGTLTTTCLGASPAQLAGTGTVNAQGLVSDINLVFDSTHGLKQRITFDSMPNQDVAVNLDLTSGWNGGGLGAGWNGAGSLTIKDGVNVHSSSGCLGCNSGSTGTATVSGAGSNWAPIDSLEVGSLGTGKLSVIDGGTFGPCNGVVVGSGSADHR